METLISCVLPRLWISCCFKIGIAYFSDLRSGTNIWTLILLASHDSSKFSEPIIECTQNLRIREFIFSSRPNFKLSYPLISRCWQVLCYSEFWPQGGADVPDKTFTKRTHDASCVTACVPPGSSRSVGRTRADVVIDRQTGVMLNFRFAVRCLRCVWRN